MVLPPVCPSRRFHISGGYDRFPPHIGFEHTGSVLNTRGSYPYRILERQFFHIAFRYEAMSTASRGPTMISQPGSSSSSSPERTATWPGRMSL
jgi:hypothetical protein